MDSKTIQELVKTTTEEIFKSMVFMDVKGGFHDGPPDIAERHLTAMVGFAGVYIGLAAINCTHAFAQKVGASMLQMKTDELSAEDVRDALGEIANMIAGRFKSQLALKLDLVGQVFEQSVPSVIEGMDYETHAVTDAPSHCIRFEDSDGIVFYVELALKEV
ncbi:chemotaxis protein CheX [bacterium]|nr:chemotaxis protein CheX [bacterium]